MPQPITHYDRECLQRLLDDSLPEPIASDVVEHVADCVDCLRQLELLAGGPEWWSQACSGAKAILSDPAAYSLKPRDGASNADLSTDDPFAADSEVVDDDWGDIGQDDPEFEAALEAAERNDSDGSAKVALIAIERSIGAWTRLRAHLPDRADELLDLLVMLDRLRRATDAQFPAARAFKRPGFDD